MPVKGTYLAVVGGGAILLWSGLKGKAWSDVLRQLIAGKKPGAATTAYTISGTPSTAVGTGVAGESGGALLSPVAPTASETVVITAVLAGVGAPPTKANISSMSAWRQHESPWNSSPPDGAQYTHNPWNTTLAAGSTGIVNSVGVRVYPNWAVGIADTVATLRGYPAILARLRSGVGLCGWSSPEFDEWSGNGYGSVC